MNDVITDKYVIFKQGTTQFGCPFSTLEWALTALKGYKNDRIIDPDEIDLYKVAKIEVKIVELFDVN